MENQAGGQDPRLDRAGPSRSGLGPRRLVWGAFAASVVVHVVIVALYASLFPRIVPSRANYVVPVGTPTREGMQVMRVVEIDARPDVDVPAEPELEPVRDRDAAVERPGVEEAPVVDFARPGISAVDRLRPRISDERLWAPLPDEFRQLTLQQREELALSGRLRDWYDSVSAAADGDRSMTDWTFTDDDGRRWGLADGQLFLGGLTLPLPSFAPPPGSEARERAWQWDEITRQGRSMAIQQTVRERMEAIRARRDAERAAQRGDTVSDGN